MSEIATALLVGTQPTTALPVWAYMIVGLVPAIAALLGGVKWYTGRLEKRLLGAQGDKLVAESDLTEAKTEEIKEQLRLSVLESVRDDMTRQREDTARALASEKEAIAEVAILIAQHQRDRAEWKQQKHEYENTIRALRLEVDGLREEVRTLRVALGVEQGRRIDDDRISQLEQRATVSESAADVARKRADRAQERAEIAKDVADEQEHRNDDTPGHA